MTAHSISEKNYIYNKSPDSYGKGDEYYQEQVPKIVGHGVRLIQENVAGEKDLEQLFFPILDLFCKMRQAIAVKTQSKDVKYFGLRRGSEEGISEGHSYTCLSKQYQEYGDTMLEVIQSKLRKMSPHLRGFDTTTFRETTSCMGRKSSFEVEVLDSKAMEERGWIRDIDIFEVVKTVGDAPDMKTKMERLKTKRPDLYKQDKMVFFVKGIYNAFPSPKLVQIPGRSPEYIGAIENLKSHWVLATTRIQINNKMYALSQYLTFMYFNHRNDAVERMTGKSKVTVLHQDMLLVDDTLKDIAKVFKQCVMWNDQEGDHDSLKGRVALFRYLFAHAMPTLRGSAAIGEWFEAAIYQHHGLSVSYERKGTVDLDALTSDSLSNFVGKYNRNVCIA